ncbi:GEVED domain-containing protein [Tamlana sp. 2201CG12-4]|uniref:GEVED domain-containing protein n=1 Tax=Tamlana sp. 2201CG12-4 TaxID=3112582 RepID=UPI002DB5DDF8|nr:GEVED domain-containing protein [Tamlana sp. 2201CG12-4]MEC3905520.1 GEVED domain-containing protein [Tamlana sp. 2201CG12-4]
MKKNKLKTFISLLFLGMMIFSSCEDDDRILVDLDEIELTDSVIQLNVDEVQKIVVSPSPDNASENLMWTSSDEQVAKIQFTENGLVAGVKGISLGSAILTVKNQNGSITETIEVNVIIKIETIELEEEPNVDPSTTKYNVLFTPEDATITEVTWASSDPGIISVDQNGNVTAVSPGVAIITVTSMQGGKIASVELVASGNPPILGLQYCSVEGTGSYNTDTVTTSGANLNIDHAASQPANNYGFYENEILEIAAEGSFTLALTQSNNWSKSKVYIDWNGDKDFEDAGELVIEFGLDDQLNNGPFSQDVNIPAEAKVGNTIMRIITSDAWVTPGLCGVVPNQTVKDFPVTIGGIAYCTISGTGSYNAETITTTGADMNLDHADGQPSGNYKYYASETLTVTRGASFDLSLIQSNNWSKSKVFIDWNANGDFEDTGELVIEFGADNQLNDGPFSQTVNVPADAAVETVRMRILTLDAWGGHGLCGEVANQTTKDFKVNIQ